MNETTKRACTELVDTAAKGINVNVNINIDLKGWPAAVAIGFVCYATVKIVEKTCDSKNQQIQSEAA